MLRLFVWLLRSADPEATQHPTHSGIHTSESSTAMLALSGAARNTRPWGGASNFSEILHTQSREPLSTAAECTPQQLRRLACSTC